MGRLDELAGRVDAAGRSPPFDRRDQAGAPGDGPAGAGRRSARPWRPSRLIRLATPVSLAPPDRRDWPDCRRRGRPSVAPGSGRPAARGRSGCPTARTSLPRHERVVLRPGPPGPGDRAGPRPGRAFGDDSALGPWASSRSRRGNGRGSRLPPVGLVERRGRHPQHSGRPGRRLDAGGFRSGATSRRRSSSFAAGRRGHARLWRDPASGPDSNGEVGMSGSRRHEPAR